MRMVYQGSPYLYHHRVFCCTDKCFDVEQLFDLAEEYPYQPPPFVKFSNCICCLGHFVGDDFNGLLIDIVPNGRPPQYLA